MGDSGLLHSQGGTEHRKKGTFCFLGAEAARKVECPLFLAGQAAQPPDPVLMCDELVAFVLFVLVSR